MIENEAMNITSDEFNLREQLADIDASIEEQKRIIEISEATEELMSNQAFRTVILDEYITKEAARLCEILTEPNPLKRDQIENVIEMTSAIRHFKTFLRHKREDGEQAENTIEQLNKLREEVCAGNAEI